MLGVLSGCVTTGTRGVEVGEAVQPGPGERVKIDEVLLVVDVSGSMYGPDKYKLGKELTRSFVAAMPSGNYRAGLLSFGGEWTNEWVRHHATQFDRSALQTSVSRIQWLRGSTPLPTALAEVNEGTSTRPGMTAVVILSDGQSDRVKTLDLCNQIQNSHQGGICFYTVHLGHDCDDGNGHALLNAIATVNECGKLWEASDIIPRAGMEDMIRTIFFGPGSYDSDGDGVPDDQDQCPNTPRGAKVDERGCWVLSGLNFDTDKSDIKPEFNGLLDDVAAVLNNNPSVRIRVDGHTDSRGSDAYNQGLSERRAQAVQAALGQRGIAADRLSAQGFGERKPAASNATSQGRYQNRRVELTPIN